jgi:hypothetical protein
VLRRIPDVFRTQRRKAAKVKHLSCLSGCVLEVVVIKLDATPTKKVSKNHANRDENYLFTIFARKSGNATAKGNQRRYHTGG